MSIVRGHESRSMREGESKLIAHRNKLLGLWAAERMGMMGEVAVEYALSLVGTDFTKTRNDAALVKKVCEDMGARGYPIAEADVGRQLAACATKARAEILPGPES
ncbi:MAG TPA: ATPase inhibitor subunit zeta [Stellaceae bacterium]|nr:ATPase inhibitor subunit zeta [Stellaceae bacterium]